MVLWLQIRSIVIMIKSSAFEAQTTNTLMLRIKPGRTYVAVQNHDAINPIVFTLGGADAVLSPPNGVQVKAGEFGEIKGDVQGLVNIISGTGAVDCTVLTN
jgi:hypothetical protein